MSQQAEKKSDFNKHGIRHRQSHEYKDRWAMFKHETLYSIMSFLFVPLVLLVVILGSVVYFNSKNQPPSTADLEAQLKYANKKIAILEKKLAQQSDANAEELIRNPSYNSAEPVEASVETTLTADDSNSTQEEDIVLDFNPAEYNLKTEYNPDVAWYNAYTYKYEFSAEYPSNRRGGDGWYLSFRSDGSLQDMVTDFSKFSVSVYWQDEKGHFQSSMYRNEWGKVLEDSKTKGKLGDQLRHMLSLVGNLKKVAYVQLKEKITYAKAKEKKR